MSGAYASRERDGKSAMTDGVPVTRGWKRKPAIKSPHACKADIQTRSSFHRLLMRKADRCPSLLAGQRRSCELTTAPFRESFSKKFNFLNFPKNPSRLARSEITRFRFGKTLSSRRLLRLARSPVRRRWHSSWRTAVCPTGQRARSNLLIW